MCEVLDRIENRGIDKGIKIGEDNMRAEVDALRAEKDVLSAEKDVLSAEKDAALAEKDIALAELAHMRELLAKHHIVIA